MSRAELGDAVAAAIYHATGRVVTVEAGYVGRLERGEVRWPAAAYRNALLTVLGVDDAAALGFFTGPPSSASQGPVVEVEPAPDVSPERILTLRLDLGRQLAAWREAAALTPSGLARRVGHPRTVVVAVENGRRDEQRGFWETADRELGADGVLLKAFDELDELLNLQHHQRAHPPGHLAQPPQAGRRPAGSRPPRHPHAPPRPNCGCAVVVGRWGWREVRALREALRLPVRAFAAHLGTPVSAVSTWEQRTRTTRLHLTTEELLDRALKLADHDTRTRFLLLLHDTTTDDA